MMALPTWMTSVRMFLATPQITLDKQAGLTLIVHQLRPDSTGSIHVQSADPGKQPAIRFNFLSATTDRYEFHLDDPSGPRVMVVIGRDGEG